MTTLTNVRLDLPAGFLTTNDLSPNAEIASSQLAQKPMQAFPVPFALCKTWDAMTVNLPAAAAADDLGFVTGTPGTDSPKLSTGDLKAAGATSRKTAFELSVPANWESGQTIELRLVVGMETTIADNSATVDVEVYKPDGTGSVGSDLCTTAAQSINSLTPANLDFTLNANSIDPGDKLIVVVTAAINDAATGTAVIGSIFDMTCRCDTRG